jgi:hypothetical protein
MAWGGKCTRANDKSSQHLGCLVAALYRHLTLQPCGAVAVCVPEAGTLSLFAQLWFVALAAQ